MSFGTVVCPLACPASTPAEPLHGHAVMVLRLATTSRKSWSRTHHGLGFENNPNLTIHFDRTYIARETIWF